MTMPTKAQIFEHWMDLDWLDKNGLDWGMIFKVIASLKEK